MESIDKVIEKWNDYSSNYGTVTEPTFLQTAITLYNLAS